MGRKNWLLCFFLNIAKVIRHQKFLFKPDITKSIKSGTTWNNEITTEERFGRVTPRQWLLKKHWRLLLPTFTFIFFLVWIVPNLLIYFLNSSYYTLSYKNTRQRRVSENNRMRESWAQLTLLHLQRSCWKRKSFLLITLQVSLAYKSNYPVDCL